VTWFAHDCQKHGHRYEARYDLGAADLSQFEDFRGSNKSLEALRKKTYIHDICVRCGDVIKNKPPLVIENGVLKPFKKE